jgi:hypothetical protein
MIGGEVGNASSLFSAKMPFGADICTPGVGSTCSDSTGITGFGVVYGIAFSDLSSAANSGPRSRYIY